jgi:hypothetical protein
MARLELLYVLANFDAVIQAVVSLLGGSPANAFESTKDDSKGMEWKPTFGSPEENAQRAVPGLIRRGGETGGTRTARRLRSSF